MVMMELEVACITRRDSPMVLTCLSYSPVEKDAVDTLHFDTEHYNHIVWTTPEELREKLKEPHSCRDWGRPRERL